MDPVETDPCHDPDFGPWRMCPDCGSPWRTVYGVVDACPECSGRAAAEPVADDQDPAPVSLPLFP